MSDKINDKMKDKNNKQFKYLNESAVGKLTSYSLPVLGLLGGMYYGDHSGAINDYVHQYGHNFSQDYMKNGLWHAITNSHPVNGSDYIKDVSKFNTPDNLHSVKMGGLAGAGIGLAGAGLYNLLTRDNLLKNKQQPAQSTAIAGVTPGTTAKTNPFFQKRPFNESTVLNENFFEKDDKYNSLEPEKRTTFFKKAKRFAQFVTPVVAGAGLGGLVMNNIGADDYKDMYDVTHGQSSDTPLDISKMSQEDINNYAKYVQHETGKGMMVGAGMGAGLYGLSLYKDIIDKRKNEVNHETKHEQPIQPTQPHEPAESPQQPTQPTQPQPNNNDRYYGFMPSKK